MYKTSIALAGTLFGAALIAGHSSPTLAQSIKAETAGPGCPHTVMILSAKYASRAGVNIQVNEGKTLTKSAMLVAQKKIDVDPLITQELPLKEWEQGFAALENMEALKVVLIP